MIFGAATRVMSLRDGTKKMSKSDSSDYSRINMTDDADTIALKIRKAKTDPQPLPATSAEAEARPEADNLLGIYAALADSRARRGDRALRRRATSPTSSATSPSSRSRCWAAIGGEMRRLLADPGYIDGVLRRGAARADAIAGPHLREVFDIMGLLRA